VTNVISGCDIFHKRSYGLVSDLHYRKTSRPFLNITYKFNLSGDINMPRHNRLRPFSLLVAIIFFIIAAPAYAFHAGTWSVTGVWQSGGRPNRDYDPITFENVAQIGELRRLQAQSGLADIALVNKHHLAGCGRFRQHCLDLSYYGMSKQVQN
jgi:hypothetical protein